jgi:hypothetical protein
MWGFSHHLLLHSNLQWLIFQFTSLANKFEVEFVTETFGVPLYSPMPKDIGPKTTYLEVIFPLSLF